MGGQISGCVRSGGSLGGNAARAPIGCRRGGCEVSEGVHNACGSVGNLLFESQTVTTEAWQYVGEGKGGYAKQQSYSFVGPGQGSFDEDAVGGCCGRVKKCCLFFLVLAVVFGVGYVMLVGDTKEGRREMEKVVRQVEDTLPEIEAGLERLTKPSSGQQPAVPVAPGSPQSIVGGKARRYVCATGARETRVDNAVYAEWDAMDKDKNGEVSREEIMEQQETLSSESTKKLLHADADESGALSFEEFASALSSEALEERRLRGDGKRHEAAHDRHDSHDKAIAIESWSLDQRRWCCGHWAVGCDGLKELEQKAAEAGRHFNCSAGLSDWQEGWTEHKKQYCCKHTKKAGCPPEAHHRSHQQHEEAAAKHASPSPVHKPEASDDPYECKADKHWREAWASDKKEWCCKHRKTGCEPEVSYECSGRAALWSKAQLRWCCDKQKIGCADLEDIGADDELKALGCDATCEVNGRSSSCKERVMWHAEHDFPTSADRCSKSMETVLQSCDVCGSCDVADTGCRAPEHQDAAEGHVEAAPRGCDAVCERNGQRTSCKERVMWHAQHDFPTDTDRCSKSLDAVVQSCSECSTCELADTGCEAPEHQEPELKLYECGDDAPEQWSMPKQKWCCEHHQKGCEEHMQDEKVQPAEETERPLEAQEAGTVPGGCNVMCAVRGVSFSCAERIEWLAGHSLSSEPNHCSKSRDTVLLECPTCRQCSISETSCTEGGDAAFDCDRDLSSWKWAWSSEKKRYCCEKEQKGCEGTVP